MTRYLSGNSRFRTVIVITDSNAWNWTQVIGWMGWAIGIIALLIQIKSFRDQKKLEKGYVTLLEQARRDWEGKYDEKQLADLAHELSQLEKKIENEIPKQARQVFVRDQLETLSEAIGELYAHHSKLSAELANEADPVALPANLRSAIETTILPSYLVKQRRQRLIHLLLAAILTVVILVNYSFFIFWLSTGVKIGSLRYRLGFLLWFGLLLSLFIWLLSRLFRRRVGPWFRRRSILSLLALTGSSLFGILLFLFLLLISQNWYYTDYDEWSEWLGRSIGMIIVSLPLSFAIVASWHTLAPTLIGRTRMFKGSWDTAHRTKGDT